MKALILTGCGCERELDLKEPLEVLYLYVMWLPRIDQALRQMKGNQADAQREWTAPTPVRRFDLDGPRPDGVLVYRERPDVDANSTLASVDASITQLVEVASLRSQLRAARRAADGWREANALHASRVLELERQIAEMNGGAPV